MTKKQNLNLREAAKTLQRAENLRLAGDYFAAEKLCKTLIGAFSGYFGAIFTLGLVYSDKGQHKKRLSD